MIKKDIVFRINEELEYYSDSDNRTYMQAYMKDKFLFWGVKSPERKLIFQDIWRVVKQLSIEETMGLVSDLWAQPEREAQYIAMDILHKIYKKLDVHHLGLIEGLILNKSWWDTVDFLAARVTGHILSLDENLKQRKVEEWLSSDDLWLKRTALLFQMFYKNKTDFELLKHIIEVLKVEDNFFIRKGIGWILRQYSKSNKKAVTRYLEATSGLSNLSIREASKYL